MRTSARPNTSSTPLGIVLWAILCLMFGLASCGGGSGGDSSADISPDDLQPTNFDMVYERPLSTDEAGGLLVPRVMAKVDSDGLVHMVYYTSGTDLNTLGLPTGSDLFANPERFLLMHGVWDPVTQTLVGSEEAISVTPPYTNDSPVQATDQGIDNCHILGLGFLQDATPVVAFQGGARPQSEDGLSCNSFRQGDLMVAMPGAGGWQDFLGIQGDASNKNPLFTDGQMGVYGDMAIGSDGVIHMIAQHYYEACDLHGITYPDLLYVQQGVSDLGYFQTSMEEYVDEYNIYGTGGGIQNAMGYFCKLILDSDDQPVAVYFAVMANGQRVIRASWRVAGQWQAETVAVIDDDYTVGHLSPAIADDGTLSVAYFLEQISDNADLGDHLRFSRRNEAGEWDTTLVDYASFCGNYCTLTLDANQQPAIVYYDERPYSAYRERFDVKLAHFNGRSWNKETVFSDGNVGWHNSIWFDADNTAYICTYDQEGQKIMVLRKRIQ